MDEQDTPYADLSCAVITYRYKNAKWKLDAASRDLGLVHSTASPPHVTNVIELSVLLWRQCDLTKEQEVKFYNAWRILKTYRVWKRLRFATWSFVYLVTPC